MGDAMDTSYTPNTSAGAEQAHAPNPPMHAHAQLVNEASNGAPREPRASEALRLRESLDRRLQQARDTRPSTSAGVAPLVAAAVANQPPPPLAGQPAAQASAVDNPIYVPFSSEVARAPELYRTPLRVPLRTDPDPQVRNTWAASSAPPRRPLPTLPKFAGGYVPGMGRPSTAVADYEFEVEHCVKLHSKAWQDHDVSEEEIVMMLGGQTEGAAKEWYRRLCKAENPDYPRNPALLTVKGWLAAVREKFTDPNVDLATRHRFAHLAMGTRKGALRAYNNAFNDCIMLLGRLDAAHEEDNKFDYMEGLRSDARRECARLPNLNSMTLNDLQRMLERLEMASFDAGFYDPSYQPRYGGGPTPMELGSTAMARADEYGDRDRQQRRGGGRGGRGSQGSRGDRGGRGRGQGGPRGKTPRDPKEEALRKECYEKGLCFRCNKPGHLARDCTEPAKNSGNEKGGAPKQGASA